MRTGVHALAAILLEMAANRDFYAEWVRLK
jgi:hypothetical protein